MASHVYYWHTFCKPSCDIAYNAGNIIRWHLVFYSFDQYPVWLDNVATGWEIFHFLFWLFDIMHLFLRFLQMNTYYLHIPFSVYNDSWGQFWVLFQMSRYAYAPCYCVKYRACKQGNDVVRILMYSDQGMVLCQQLLRWNWATQAIVWTVNITISGVWFLWKSARVDPGQHW